MKKGYGCPITKFRDSIVSQRTWRAIGLFSLAVCGVMAWYGAKPGMRELTWNVLAVYWGIFLLALLVTLYMVLLDFRYIRLMYLQEEREIFEDTLGDEEFRKALRDRARPSRPVSTRDESP